MRKIRFCVLFTIIASILSGSAAKAMLMHGKAAGHHYASVLMEVQSGMILGGTDPDTALPIGSLTKLMTVYLAAEAVTEGKFTLQTLLAAPPDAQKQQGAVIWLTGGEKMSAEDLLKGIIIGNANDAAYTVACKLAGSEEMFVREMNAAAFSLGMRDTRFSDCTGQSEANISTAADMARLCCVLLKYDFLIPMFTTWRTFLREGKTELVAENKLTRTYENLTGFKAGHGDACGYTLAAGASRGGLSCVAVILGCDDESERYTYAKNLLANGFSNYRVTTPDFAGEFLHPVAVHGGKSGAVTVEPDTLCGIAVKNGTEITCETVLPKYVNAPITKGQNIGVTAFYCGDSQVYEVTLRAAESVAKREFVDSFTMLLENLFK